MSDKDQAVLKIEQLTKRYNPKHGIEGINLTVSAGEVFGFLGPNGAGKSTTINTILDILRPDAGKVQVLGLDHHKDVKEVHRHVGYLSGDMETDPSLTGKQYLNFVAHIRGGIKQEQIEMLATRLKADLSTKIKHLSRGSKQKIGLIAALMHDPDILILDEPTSGLDPLIQEEFSSIIKEHKNKGKTAFISSHVLSEVQGMCDRVGFIRDGQLVDVSTLESLLQRAPRRVVAQFKDTLSLDSLRKLSGASGLQQNDRTVSFSFRGDVNELVSILGEHSLQSLQITETDLEELFMSYYRGEEKTQNV